MRKPKAVTMSGAAATIVIPPYLARASRIAALCIALLFLGGCSVLRMGYSQAEWLAYRWLDAYADFDAAQAPRMREAIASWFAWHRRTQLPDYAGLLLRIDAEVLADTSAERVCGWWGAVRTRYDLAIAHAVPAIADVAATLKPEQFESIERRYAKSNAEFRDEFLQPDLARRNSESLRRVIDRAESFYGELDPFQRERLERWLADSPWDPKQSFEERRRRQQDALQTLRRLAREPVEGSAAREQIRGWVLRLDRSPREPFPAYAEKLVQSNCGLAANLHNSTSPAQRRLLSQKLRAWAADFSALSAVATH